MTKEEIIERACKEIKVFEGLSLRPYVCPAGVWTIGYGHTSKTEPYPLPDESVAFDLLKIDVNDVYEDIDQQLHKQLLPTKLNDNQMIAMLCLVFNIGIGNFKKSTILKLINAGKLNLVPAEIVKWNHANGKVLMGLVKRRQREADIWQGKL